ncbi:TPT-domain-containing protein [Pseudovirgaria hyperparasitica]|uniref:TPT-domain-containing protein n=1 Tax=Pseudovirgaria hyperparasitica TaxID=470096 RepID=A0A6A6W2V2_9PEZI|nr:TPT-domain-containing protein [Pseudovirgaria hyperparasitica]KAF2756923.1 TPT-domain-containing protein [Pseudovirgaria hyperparasitica]
MLTKARENIITALCVALNALSTVGLVFLSKIVFSDEQLKHCQVGFVIWHFIVTSLVLYVSSTRLFRLFNPIRLSVRAMLPICLFFAGYVILGNLSLANNSIGTYQLAKIMTTPSVVIINFILFRKTIDRYRVGAIIAVCIGVSLTITEEARSNLVGIIFATAAFIITAFYQIWIGKKITDLDVSAPQLLMNQAPLAVLLLIPFVPFFDTMPNLSQASSNALWAVFGSGVMASMINLSQFLIISRTSALTFNIVGHVKTILILGLGWYTEKAMPSEQEIIGIVLALWGGYAYSHFSMNAR